MAQNILLNTDSLEALLRTFFADGDWAAFVAGVANLLYLDNSGLIVVTRLLSDNGSNCALIPPITAALPRPLIVRVDECTCQHRLFADNWELIRRAIAAAANTTDCDADVLDEVPFHRAVLGVVDKGCDCK